jgi:hypothetical protein
MKPHLVTTPGKHRQGDRNRDIDTYLSNICFGLKFTRRRTRLGKYRGTIAIPICVNDIQSIVEVISSDHDQHWTEDLFAVRYE